MTNPFASLAPLREKPIPPQRRLASSDYRALPINTDDARADEPLVDAADFKMAGRNHYAHNRNAPYYAPAPGALDKILLRKSIAEALAAVNAQLNKAGLELFIFDGWRPIEVQRYFYETWTPRELQRRNPTLQGEALEAEVSTYWARPTDNPGSPAPHATGAAVDLTIRWKNADPLWMGTLFDDPAPASHPCAFETEANGISFTHEEARANRRLLYWLMTDADFAINPTEWWHFSKGDQMWAALTGAPAAYYGEARP